MSLPISGCPQAASGSDNLLCFERHDSAQNLTWWVDAILSPRNH
jgi:hypothetical protein